MVLEKMNNIYFFSYKFINITYFMAFVIFSGVLGYIVSGILAKEYKVDKSKIQDIFLLLLITGFLGSRLGYVLMNIGYYKENLLSALSLSHYNLSLLGGAVSGVLTLLVVSAIYNIDFFQLLRIFSIPFYLSIAIGIWVMKFDNLVFLSSSIGSKQINVLLVSIVNIIAMILEFYLRDKFKNKYITPIILVLVMVFYYMI